MPDFRVIVIGGGLAGLLLGNGLLHHQIDFCIFEADPEISERDGFQIRLGAPALAGFKACLDEEQQRTLYGKFGRSGGVISSAPVLYDADLRLLLDFTKFPAYTKSAPITRVLLRDYLSSAIRTQGRIQYQKKFVRFKCVQESSQQTKVKVFFDDGSEDVCDLLISAEGAWSKINRQVGLNNIIHLKSHWNLSAKCSLPPTKLMGLTPEAFRGPIAVSKDGLFFFFSAFLPQGYDEGSKHDTESAFVFWSLIVPEERVPEAIVDGTRDRLEFCVGQVKNWNPRFQELLRVIGPEKILVFQHHTSTEPPQNWRETAKKDDGLESGNEHVWLIGDAIHAMTPARGMGGNQALRDTADILPQIVQLAETATSLGAVTDIDFAWAAAEYEKIMFPRAFEWVRTSGGSDKSEVDASTLTGRLTIFFMARALDLAYLYGLFWKTLGYGPKDDAPELR